MPRAERALLALGCVLGLLLAAPVCRADGRSAPPRFDAEIAGGLVRTPVYGFFGYRLGLAAHYRVLDRLRLGAYLDHFRVGTTSADPGYVLGYQVTRLGARAELHILPSFVVDPWCGMALGLFFGALEVQPSTNTYPDANPPGGGVGLDTADDLGIDVHLGRVTVGVFFTLLAPLAHREIMGGGDFPYSSHASGLSGSLSLRAGMAF